MPAPKAPSIPAFSADLPSMHAAMVAMKQAIEAHSLAGRGESLEATLAKRLNVQGGEMRGTLMLEGSEITREHQAAHKKYVDDAVVAGTISAAQILALPLTVDGAGSLLIAEYEVEGKDSGAWVQDAKVDLRGLVPSVSPGGGPGLTDHGDLAGLTDDDHAQYLLVDGTRAMTGELDMGTDKIVGIVDPTSDQEAATKKYVDDSVLALADVYPIGSIYLSISATNPNTTFGFGTWAAFGEGLYLVGVPSGGTGEGTAGTALTDTESRPVGQHNHSVTDPAHTHALSSGGSHFAVNATSGASRDLPGAGSNANPVASLNTATTGLTVDNEGSVAGTNAPYIQVYMWKRTA